MSFAIFQQPARTPSRKGQYPALTSAMRRQISERVAA